MKQKTKYSIILVIFIVSLISSSIISFVPIEKSCSSEGEGCDIVQTSAYAQTFGIKNSHFGVVIFAFLTVFAIMHLKKPNEAKAEMIRFGIIGSLLVAIYFFILQFFVLKEICKYCMVVDIGAVINSGLIFFWRKQ